MADDRKLHELDGNHRSDEAGNQWLRRELDRLRAEIDRLREQQQTQAGQPAPANADSP